MTPPAGSAPFEIPLPDLTIKGFLSLTNVLNFLGIKFASTPARFRDATFLPIESHAPVLDATAYGPRCPQAGYPQLDPRRYRFEGLVPLSSEPDNAAECLRLNIYAPRDAKDLPVFVWIHGGGNVTGNGNTSLDGNFLVQKAVGLGKPFVYVSVNHRVGLDGFLTSRELREEARAKGEIGWANRGYHDQRLGLEWIQKYIFHFGGDASRLTLAGESAGALSVLAQLRSRLPPIGNQALLMSPPHWPLQAFSEAQLRFDEVTSKLGLSSEATASEKLAALRSLGNQELLEKVGVPFLFATEDEEWFGKRDTKLLEGMGKFDAGLKSVIIGFTKDETALWALGWQQWSEEELVGMVKDVLPDENFAETVLEEYGIKGGKESALRGVIDFSTETAFVGIPSELAKIDDLPVYVYRFDQKDEDSRSPFKDYAYHALDKSYVNRYPWACGQNASEASMATTNSVTERYADFIVGNEPWEKYNQGEQVWVFKGNESGLSKLDSMERYRRLFSDEEKQMIAIKAGFDALVYKPLASGKK